MEIPPNVVFIALLLVVPAQYFLSPSSSAHIKFYLHSFLDTVKPYLPEIDLSSSGESDDTVPESEQTSTLDYGLGTYERIRAPNIEFRVGDVITHKVQNYRAVVIGWDLTAKAPESFIKTAHKGNIEWTNNPNYAVLIDVRDRMVPQIGYVVQENLKLDEGMILHPLLDRYFEGYDETLRKYSMRPVIRKSYPDD